jgi:hypothetical protein
MPGTIYPTIFEHLQNSPTSMEWSGSKSSSAKAASSPVRSGRVLMMIAPPSWRARALCPGVRAHGYFIPKAFSSFTPQLEFTSAPVSPKATVQRVLTGSSEEIVLAWAAQDKVLTRAATDDILAGEPAYDIAPTEAVDDVQARRTDDDVSACR